MSAKPNAFPSLHGRWLAWALLLGLPLLFWPDTADAYSTIRWAAMSAIGTGLWLASWKRRKEIVAAIAPSVLWAMLAFLLIGLAGCPFALHPKEALWDAGRWVMALGLLLQLVYGMRVNPGILQDLWRAGTIAGIMLATLRLLQMAGIVGGIPADTDAHSATLGNPNFFAGAMVMLTALGCGAALREKGIWRWLGIAAAVLCILLTVLGGSDGAMLGLAALALVMLEGSWVMLRPASGYAKRPMIRLVLAGLGVAMGLMAFIKVISLPLADAALQPDSTLERVQLWQQSLKMVQESPLIGIGAGHWHYHILKWGTVSSYQGFATRYFMEAHNDFIQQFAERGILGGLAFVGIFAVAWLRGFRSLATPPQDLGRVAALGGLTGGLVFACTNLPAEQPYLLLLLLVFVAMVAGKSIAADIAFPENQTLGATPRKQGMALSNVLATGIFALFLLGSAASLLLYSLWLGADRANFKVMLAKGKQDWPRTANLAQKAQAWYNPHDRVSGTPLVWYEGISFLSQGNAALALPKLQAAKAMHPWHPQVSSNLGAAYYMVGDKDAAVRELTELLERFPAFGDARINLTEIHLMMGHRDEAAKVVGFWKDHTGNAQYDAYYAKVMGVLAGNPAPQGQ